VSKKEWVRICINVSYAQKRMLMEIAGKRGISVSLLIRSLIVEYAEKCDGRRAATVFFQDDEVS
jgi:hypothetical protein